MARAPNRRRDERRLGPDTRPSWRDPSCPVTIIGTRDGGVTVEHFSVTPQQAKELAMQNQARFDYTHEVYVDGKLFVYDPRKDPLYNPKGKKL